MPDSFNRTPQGLASSLVLHCDVFVKRPIVNAEEKIDKTVGNRTPPSDSFAFAMKLQKAAVELWEESKISGVPKGIYRIKPHEEADEWMMRMLARRKTKRITAGEP